jgi:hypothetical protein
VRRVLILAVAIGVLGVDAVVRACAQMWTRRRWHLVLLVLAALVLVAQVHVSGDPIDLAGVQVSR